MSTDPRREAEAAAERRYPETEWTQRATVLAFREAYLAGRVDERELAAAQLADSANARAEAASRYDGDRRDVFIEGAQWHAERTAPEATSESERSEPTIITRYDAEHIGKRVQWRRLGTFTGISFTGRIVSVDDDGLSATIERDDDGKAQEVPLNQGDPWQITVTIMEAEYDADQEAGKR